MRPAARNNRRFLLLGLGLVVVFLVCLGIYLASEQAWREAQAEFYGQFPRSFERRERFYDLQYWMLHSRTYQGIRGLMIFSGLGSLLWLVTLISRGIMWWFKRRG